MRCEQCRKFVSFDDSNEPEVDVDFVGGFVTGTVRIVLTCAECNEELKDAIFDVDVDCISWMHDHQKKACAVTVACDSVEMTQRSATKDRHGNPIKNMRYAKKYYGVELRGTVSCICGGKEAFSWNEEIQASAMEEIV